MKLSELSPAAGSTHSRKRVGRGPGSGLGKTAGRGHKGQKSRAGYSRQAGFEGGQMMLVRRIPKRGFTNLFRVEYAVVNLSRLAQVEQDEVGPERMVELGLVKKGLPVKVLGQGELGKALKVSAHKFSQSARTKIEAAGGVCEELGLVIESFRNIFAIPDLRKRLIFVFALLAVYRLGCYIPTPGIDPNALLAFMNQASGTVLGFVNTFTGGSLQRMAIFGLGIMPYVTASIILQLLTVVWPYLEKLSKEGEMGRRKITQYTRYGTVVISTVQSTAFAFWLQAQRAPGDAPLVPSPGIGFVLMTVITLTTGCAFVMWLGEQISERGIGNGISLIIFAGIVVGLLPSTFQMAQDILSGRRNPLGIAVLVAFMVLVTAGIVYMERAQRRIPVQYAKRVVGRKMYGGQLTYLPLRVNTGGVIPVIFASSVLMLPATFATMFKNEWVQDVVNYIGYGKPMHYLLYVIAIVFFSYFYVSIIFNPSDLAENMRKYGGFIPGIRPGKRTAEHIDRILSRITFVGALYLAAVAILPDFLIAGFDTAYLPFIGETISPYIPNWFNKGLNLQFYFGGTSLLIVIGVAMDFIQQVESQLVMRNYEGFMKRGRIKGRRG